ALTAYDSGDFVVARAELGPLAAAGDARAQLLLGRMSAAGQGVLQDYVRAHLLFNLAAAADMPEAAAARDEVAGRMTAEQIAEAQRLAAAWSPVPAVAPAAGAAVAGDGPDPLLDGRAVTDLQWHLALHG